MENYFADHISEDLCECVIPIKNGSSYLEVMGAEDLAHFKYFPITADGFHSDEPRPLFKLKNMKKYKSETTARDITHSFYKTVFGVDMSKIRTVSRRRMYRPRPVIWHALKTLDFPEIRAGGESDILIREHDDLAFVQSTDVTDRESYNNTLKYYLRLSVLVQNIKHQHEISGFFKYPTDEPKNECVTEEADMRNNLNDWNWLMTMQAPIAKFAENLNKDLHDLTLNELKRQKMEISQFQKAIRLGDASWWMSNGETTSYINHLHELIQMVNGVLCQSFKALNYMLAAHDMVNKDLFRLLEHLIDT